MMNPIEILLAVSKVLNNSGISYMLVGADAVNYYGRPRTTHDIDIKIALLPKDVSRIYKSFQKDFYIDEFMIQESVRNKSMFNIIHNESGMKVDFWLLKDNEYELERFKRRKKAVINENQIYITTPEDLIITKLDWYRESTSDKHYRDALGIYQIQQGRLDEEYITQWTTRKETENYWVKIKNEGQI